MFDIKVTRVVKKDINTVFDMLANHAQYKKFPGVSGSKLLEKGKTEENGLGALRMIDTGSVVLHERIVKFERPNKLGYLIEYSKPLPFAHDLGEIVLSEHEEGTLVEWSSKGRINIPFIGGMFDRRFQNMGGRSFAAILKSIEKHQAA